MALKEGTSAYYSIFQAEIFSKKNDSRSIARNWTTQKSIHIYVGN